MTIAEFRNDEPFCSFQEVCFSRRLFCEEKQEVIHIVELTDGDTQAHNSNYKRYSKFLVVLLSGCLLVILFCWFRWMLGTARFQVYIKKQGLRILLV